jgi:hypothetical protein
MEMAEPSGRAAEKAAVDSEVNNVPAKSKAQNRWINSPSGHAALGEAGVKEWNAATKGRVLPERVKPKPKKPVRSTVKRRP